MCEPKLTGLVPLVFINKYVVFIYVINIKLHVSWIVSVPKTKYPPKTKQKNKQNNNQKTNKTKKNKKRKELKIRSHQNISNKVTPLSKTKHMRKSI